MGLLNRTTRLDDLKASLPAGYSVHTHSPGDGQTRYRFFRNAPAGQSYFGPDNGIHTALGMKAAMTYAGGLGAAAPSRLSRSSGVTASQLRARGWDFWKSQPTLESGHFDNKVYDDGRFRVWVTRTTPEDYDGNRSAWMKERLTIEQRTADGWRNT